MHKVRTAVVGVGSFGRNHARVVKSLTEQAELTAVIDPNLERAKAVAAEYGTEAFSNSFEVMGRIQAAIIACPTNQHFEISRQLLEAGIDVLVEKPITEQSAQGEELTRIAEANGRILQVGHLERFNPAVQALQAALTVPLFFEVHRLSVFTPRSLDIDVVLDLMIHDIDIVLSFTRELPADIRAAGISVLSPHVDIANVRLQFPSGCVANLTASRVSTEQVRKLRLFQPGEYISLDYGRKQAVRLAVRKNEPNAGPIGFESQNGIALQHLPVTPDEPLRLELAAFFSAVRDRSTPVVDGNAATQALRIAETILAKIGEHGNLVAHTISQYRGEVV
jgi:predicted dehydrogenase